MHDASTGSRRRRTVLVEVVEGDLADVVGLDDVVPDRLAVALLRGVVVALWQALQVAVHLGAEGVLPDVGALGVHRLRRWRQWACFVWAIELVLSCSTAVARQAGAGVCLV